MEHKPHARYDEFADQFTSIMYEHWADILQIIHRQSPRVAALLQLRRAPKRSFSRAGPLLPAAPAPSRLM